MRKNKKKASKKKAVKKKSAKKKAIKKKATKKKSPTSKNRQLELEKQLLFEKVEKLEDQKKALEVSLETGDADRRGLQCTIDRFERDYHMYRRGHFSHRGEYHQMLDEINYLRRSNHEMERQLMRYGERNFGRLGSMPHLGAF